MIARRPDEAVEVPEPVERLAQDRPVSVVWRNELGGLTFAIGCPIELYVKWHPATARAGIDLVSEATRMRWAAPYVPVPVPVPVPIDLDDGDGSSWLVTRALPGRSAVDDRWKADPRRAVQAVGRGLRHLHDSAPVAQCPFSWTTEDRLAVARTRIDTGDLSATRSVGSDPVMAAADAVAFLEDHRPEDDDPVVCHGDPCAPNTLLDDDGRFLALVDLGSLGVGDRWADLAVATWSTHWNYGPGWERPLFDAYGIEADLERLRYFRLLWDVGP